MTGYTALLNIANLAISWGLLLLIWLVQIIIYPGFSRIPAHAFSNYHGWYAKRITVIVLPLMTAEGIITIFRLVLESYSINASISAICVFIIWLSTFALQVPVHKRLQSGKDDRYIRRLATTNWIRTTAWSIKAITATLATIVSFHS